MKTVNVTTLRRNLRRILESVRQGEEVEILDRNVPIARIVPVVPTTRARKGTVPPWLERLRRAGTVRVGSLKPFPEIERGFSTGTRNLGTLAVDALIDERRSGR